MLPRWLAGVLAAAGAATLLAGCGIRVVTEPSPAVERGATPAPSAPATPGITSALAPAPSASPVMPAPTVAPLVVPSPAASAVAARDEALEAAARRVEAAAQVRAALPAFAQLTESMVERSGVPGAAVAVIAGDTVMYERAFGLREMGRPELVGEDTLFQIGDVSSAYTTAMLAVVVAESELGWDQPVRAVWRRFRLHDRWATREASLRDLTAGRSGLPAQAGDELRAFGYGRAQILRRLRHLRPAAGFRTEHAPQAALVTLAATAAERATGMSWSQLVRERVLEPLGDRETTLTWRGFRRAADRATPHTRVGGSMVPQDPSDETVFAPALGVSASLRGLEVLARLHLNGGALGGVRVVPEVLLAQTMRPAASAAVSPDGPRAAAPGWMLSSFDGRLVASAEGGLASGSGAVMTLLPHDGMAVIVLANAHPEGLALGRALARTLVDLAVLGMPQEEWLGVETAALSGDDDPGEMRGLVLPPQGPAAALEPRRRAVYAGVYEDRYYGRVTVRPGSGDSLRVRLGRGETLRYLPWSGDVWRDAASGTAVVFDVRDSRAEAVTLTLLSFDGRHGRFARVD